MPTVHLIIKGRVQGVFFRATAKDVADEIGVRGWVKNTEEGDVEIVASGTDEQLQKFMSWCKRGPRKAIVTGLAATPMPDEDFNNFTVVRK
ncbi:MAG: acylphosphatase [Flavisolibacter sp.]|nr:acylphosphatase [Flavisolibacter sp.]